MTRRTFLKTSTAGAAAPVLLGAQKSPSGLSVPRPIKSFCIDFNWRRPRHEGWHNDFARFGHWAAASPEEHVAWYEALGANVIQTFCVSCNGYAWYKGGFAPPQPGLKHDFLREVATLGHKKNMLVVGYFTPGANTRWGQEHPDLSYGSPSTLHIPFTDEYLDFFCRSVEDAVKRTGIDGYMLDWVWNPSKQLREKGWLACERKLFEQLTGKKFPPSGTPSAADVLDYERKATDRCWRRVHDATKNANPNSIIFLSCNNLTEPTVAGSRMLKEVDWVLNEAPNREYFEAAKTMVGSHTRLIQCLVGWPGHDAGAYLSDPANKNIDLYGFAEPRDNSLPLAVADYLAKPVSAFQGAGHFEVNDRNIAVLARYFNGLSLDKVVPRKG